MGREAGKKYEIADRITLPGGDPLPVIPENEDSEKEDENCLSAKVLRTVHQQQTKKRTNSNSLTSSEYERSHYAAKAPSNTSDGLDSSFQSEDTESVSTKTAMDQRSIGDSGSVTSTTNTDEYEKERTYIRPPPGLNVKYPVNKHIHE